MRERGTSIDLLPLVLTQLATEFETPVCALTGSQTSDLSVRGLCPGS